MIQMIVTRVVPLALLSLAGCAPQARFVAADCTPYIGDDETEAIQFRSSFRMENMEDQQVLYEVAVLDGRERPVRSETGRYKDASGHLKAVRTVMVLQTPFTFENLSMSIPTSDIDATAKQGPAFAEFRLTTPDGVTLASQRINLPSPYAANIPRFEPRPEPQRAQPTVAAKSPTPAPRSPEPAPRSAARAPASRPASTDPALARRDAAKPPDSAAERDRSAAASAGNAKGTARTTTPQKESERTRPARRGDPPPLRPVAGSGNTSRETPPRPTATTKKDEEPKERIMAGAKENTARKPAAPASRPAASDSGKRATSQPTSRPTKASEIEKDGAAASRPVQKKPPPPPVDDEP